MITPLPVPVAGEEAHTWIASPDGMAGRARLARASGTYRSCVPGVIADYDPAVPSELAADVEEATAALTRFDGYAARVLGVASPMLGPMSAVLLRTESISSSRIENLTVGARQLALAEIGQASSSNARLVAGNVKAMEAALALAGDLSEDTILAMREALLSHQTGWESHAGRYRDRLVWVGRSGLGPVGATHVAPQPDLVSPAMGDLVAFVRRRDLPVGLQIAVAHAQFETIHPFADGNGRTGRALVHAMLANLGVVTHTTAPVSAGLLVNTETYFRALTDYRRGDARPIVERFADASRMAATTGMRLVDDLAAQVEQARGLLQGTRPQATAWRVLPHLVAQPVVNTQYLICALGLSEMTANRALRQLADAGVLQERTGYRRNRVWQHAGILQVLDAYAESLRRG